MCADCLQSAVSELLLTYLPHTSHIHVKISVLTCLPPRHTFQLWVLTEQHGKRVEELQAELRQKEVQLGQAQQGRQAQEALVAQHAQQVSVGAGLSGLGLFYLQEDGSLASAAPSVVHLLYRLVGEPSSPPPLLLPLLPGQS